MQFLSLNPLLVSAVRSKERDTKELVGVYCNRTGSKTSLLHPKQVKTVS